MWLLDTNVISEMRKLYTGRADASVERWAASTFVGQMYLSTMTVFEIETGIVRLRRKDKFQADILHDWLHNRVLPEFGRRVIAVDTDIALRCAGLHATADKSDHDSFIAATALVHGFTVATRNVKDFVPMGVKVLNPWEG